MPRTRNIRPGFFKNESLAELPIEARLAFVGLWTLADREGRLEDRPARIRAELFPYDNLDMDAVLASIAALKEHDGRAAFVDRYIIDGRGYIQIINFAKHQKPHGKATASTIPACPEHAPRIEQAPIQDQPSTDLGNGECALDPCSLILDPREGSKSGVPDPLAALPVLSDIFPHINTAILAAHNKARIPKPGTVADLKARGVLETLVRLDKYPEQDVSDCLAWVLHSKDESAVFWRRQLQALAPLRTVRGDSGLSKFGKIHEAWEKARHEARKGSNGTHRPGGARRVCADAGKAAA